MWLTYLYTVPDIYCSLVANYNRVPDDWPPGTQIYCLWNCTSLNLAAFLLMIAYTIPFHLGGCLFAIFVLTCDVRHVGVTNEIKLAVGHGLWSRCPRLKIISRLRADQFSWVTAASDSVTKSLSLVIFKSTRYCFSSYIAAVWVTTQRLFGAVTWICIYTRLLPKTCIHDQLRFWHPMYCRHGPVFWGLHDAWWFEAGMVYKLL